MTREDELRQQLVDLHRELRERSQPIVDELAAIMASKPPLPIVIMPDMLGPNAGSIIERHLGRIDLDLLGPLGGDY